MNNYKEFTITAIPFIPEVLAGVLWELNITGIQEEDTFIKVFCPGVSSTNQIEISAQIQKLVKEKVIESFVVIEKVLENKNWNEDWEKSRDLNDYLHQYVFVERDQVVVPSLNLKAAKKVICRNEQQKKKKKP